MGGAEGLASEGWAPSGSREQVQRVMYRKLMNLKVIDFKVTYLVLWGLGLWRGPGQVSMEGLQDTNAGLRCGSHCPGSSGCGLQLLGRSPTLLKMCSAC